MVRTRTGRGVEQAARHRSVSSHRSSRQDQTSRRRSASAPLRSVISNHRTPPQRPSPRAVTRERTPAGATSSRAQIPGFEGNFPAVLHDVPQLGQGGGAAANVFSSDARGSTHHCGTPGAQPQRQECHAHSTTAPAQLCFGNLCQPQGVSSPPAQAASTSTQGGGLTSLGPVTGQHMHQHVPPPQYVMSSALGAPLLAPSGATTHQLCQSCLGSQAAPPPREVDQSGERTDFPPLVSNVFTQPLSVSVSPLSLNVPQKLKDKIWAHKFVNLDQLLSKQEGSNKLKLEWDSQQGYLVCAPADKPSTFLPIEKWTSAFLIFMYIYLEKFGQHIPQKALDLLQYLETIRFAAIQYGGSGWLRYDEHVRRTWSSPSVPFSKMHGDFWLRFITTGRANTFRPPSSPQGRSCNDFNKGKCFRPTCIYAHVCNRCGAADHGSFANKCTRKPKPGSNQPNSPSNQPHPGKLPPQSRSAPKAAS